MSLRSDFSVVHWIMNTESLPLSREQRLKSTENMKRSIRQSLSCKDTRPKYHYRDECGESFWFKEFFNTPFSEEEKEEYIENEWRHIYSPWDCTGQVFTTDIKIINFKEPNSLGKMSVVYHFMALDV